MRPRWRHEAVLVGSHRETEASSRRRSSMADPVLETRTFQAPPPAHALPADVSSSALVHRVRWHTGLSQAGFAQAYGIDLDQLRGLEAGLMTPDRALVAYLTVIDRAPELVRA